MAPLKQRGDLAELAVATDLIRLGHRVAFPYGEDCDFDLILVRDTGELERVQVKHARSDGNVLEVKCFTHSPTGYRVRSVKHYTSEHIDWLAVYDATTRRCFYVPAAELGSGRHRLSLRLQSPLVGWRSNMRRADDYTEPAAA